MTMLVVALIVIGLCGVVMGGVVGYALARIVSDYEATQRRSFLSVFRGWYTR